MAQDEGNDEAAAAPALFTRAERASWFGAARRRPPANLPANRMVRHGARTRPRDRRDRVGDGRRHGRQGVLVYKPPRGAAARGSQGVLALTTSPWPARKVRLLGEAGAMAIRMWSICCSRTLKGRICTVILFCIYCPLAGRDCLVSCEERWSMSCCLFGCSYAIICSTRVQIIGGLE